MPSTSMSPEMSKDVAVRTPVTPKVPPIVTSSVTVRSSCTFKSTTFKDANASTIAAPEPAPDRFGEPVPLEVFVEIQVSSPPSFLAADVEPAVLATF